MEELREIAKSYYDEGSTEVQNKATLFFESMDADHDGRVDMEEFLTFLRDQGYDHMRNNDFFRLLDRDGNGSLDFTDVMTLYYIIKSGRPFCNLCAKFISGVFFTCVRCHNASPRVSFNICHSCHKSRRCEHSDDGGGAFFLDNYTLLQAITSTTKETITTTIRATQQIPSSSSTQQIPSSTQQVPSSSSSTQQIPSSTQQVPSSSSSTQQVRSSSSSTKQILTIHPPQRILSSSDSPQSPITSFVNAEFNRVLAQTQTPPPVSLSIATPSTVNTLQVNESIPRPDHDASLKATVPTNPLQSQMKPAELAFKALEGAILLTNVATALGGACTIM